jgi:CcmD family protein
MRFRVLVGLLLLAAVAANTGHAVAASAQPAAQEQFVPISELPPEEQLPAPRLLIAAYAFVWVAILTYLWFLWRRLGNVERELADVASRLAEKRR